MGLHRLLLEVAVDQPEAAPGALRRVQVLPLGEPRVVDGRKFRVDPKDIALVLGDHAARKSELPVLWEHGAGPRGGEAAGWIRGLEADATGLWAAVEWLPETVELIRAEKWRYLSPGFFGAVDEDDFIRPRVLYEVSLTNTPAIDGMAPVSAQAQPSSPTEASNRKEIRMEKLRALLGLADGASEDDFVNAVEKLKAPPAEAPPPAPPTDVQLATVTATKELVQGLVAKELEAERKTAQVQAAVERAVRAGKVTVAQRDEAITFATASLEAFEKFVAASPRVAPVSPGVDLGVGETVVQDGNSSEAIDRRAQEYRVQQRAQGMTVSYRDAVVAVTTKGK